MFWFPIWSLVSDLEHSWRFQGPCLKTCLSPQASGSAGTQIFHQEGEKWSSCSVLWRFHRCFFLFQSWMCDELTSNWHCQFHVTLGFSLSHIPSFPSSTLVVQFSSITQLCPTLATTWIAAGQASLSISNSRSSLRLMSIESVMPSSHRSGTQLAICWLSGSPGVKKKKKIKRALIYSVCWFSYCKCSQCGWFQLPGKIPKYLAFSS